MQNAKKTNQKQWVKKGFSSDAGKYSYKKPDIFYVFLRDFLQQQERLIYTSVLIKQQQSPFNVN